MPATAEEDQRRRWRGERLIGATDLKRKELRTREIVPLRHCWRSLLEKRRQGGRDLPVTASEFAATCEGHQIVAASCRRKTKDPEASSLNLLQNRSGPRSAVIATIGEDD